MAQQFYLAAITVVLLGRSQAIIRSSHMFQTDFKSPPRSNGLYNVPIEYFPWHAYVTAGESICSGTIIHSSWVMVLRSCEIVEENGAYIKVHAGGATPDEVRQVVNAENHRGNERPNGGFMLLRLTESLAFDEYVQPARLGSRDPKVEIAVDYVLGYSSEENQIQLQGYLAVYNSTSTHCPSAGFLCALRVGAPSAHSTIGIDFLEMMEAQTIGGELQICLIGGKMETIGNILDKYYPIVDALPWLQDETGLKFVPTPPAGLPNLPALCGLLQ